MNEETRDQTLEETLRDMNAGIGVSKPYHDTDEMWRDLGIDMPMLREIKKQRCQA